MDIVEYFYKDVSANTKLFENISDYRCVIPK